MHHCLEAIRYGANRPLAVACLPRRGHLLTSTTGVTLQSLFPPSTWQVAPSSTQLPNLLAHGWHRAIIRTRFPPVTHSTTRTVHVRALAVIPRAPRPPHRSRTGPPSSLPQRHCRPPRQPTQRQPPLFLAQSSLWSPIPRGARRPNAPGRLLLVSVVPARAHPSQPNQSLVPLSG